MCTFYDVPGVRIFVIQYCNGDKFINDDISSDISSFDHKFLSITDVMNVTETDAKTNKCHLNYSYLGLSCSYLLHQHDVISLLQDICILRNCPVDETTPRSSRTQSIPRSIRMQHAKFAPEALYP